MRTSAFFDLLTCLAARLVVLSLQLYGVDADMDEQLRAVRRRHGNGVSGLKHHIHRAVRRSNDASFGRLDRNARTENALCERGIGHVSSATTLPATGAVISMPLSPPNRFFSLPNILLTTFLIRQYRMIEQE